MSDAAASLRRKLLRWLLVPLLALFACSSGVSYYVAVRFADLAHDSELYDVALAMWQQVRVSGGRALIRLPREALQILEFDSRDKIYVRVSEADGRFISGSRALPDPPAPGPNSVSFYDARVAGEPVRVALLRERLPESNVEIVVQAAETRVKRDLFANDILAAVVIPQAVIIAVAGVLVWFGVRRGLRPLQQLADAVGGRSCRDLSPIPERDAPTEVRPLTRAINDLLSHLGAAFDSQQRFIADAAHQLRTPVAGLAAWVERARHAKDMVTLMPALKQLEISSHRATRLVSQLLALARAEPSAKPQQDFRTIDLAQLARRVCRDWVPQARARDVDLGYCGPDDGVAAWGHDMLLEELISNLLDNAIIHGGAGGKVTVHVTPGPESMLGIEDEGPGIPEAERSRVLERFYRMAGTPGAGSGLGLAIGHEIARAHGGELVITQPDSGQGTLVSLRFPAQSLALPALRKCA